MCGIVGVVTRRKNADTYVSRVKEGLSKIKHRGADDQNIYSNEDVCMGYVRLAIRGLTPLYNQPIVSGDIVSFANGEVYSKEGLPVNVNKNDLQPLVDELSIKKEKIFNQYDADFAVCQYNKKTRRFYLARDLFGVKPLYYSWIDEDTLAFASEIKGIKSILNTENEINSQTVFDYMVFGYPVEDRTFYKNIHVFPTKSVFEWDLVENTKKYYNAKFKENKIEKVPLDEEIMDEIYEPLKEAVKNRLISDRKLGMHLSGGLDSSLIAYLANEIDESSKDFYTAYNSKEDNDLRYSKIITDLMKSKQKKIQIPKDKDYEGLITTLDSPIMSSGAFVPYLISGLANENSEVVLLAGQGADELFFGYHRFQKMKENMNIDELIEMLSNSDYDMLQKLFPNKNIKDTIKNRYKDYIDKKDKNVFEKAQEFYINNFLAELLHIEDHVHMKYHIENRVPFLSLPVWNWIVENRIKINGENNKIPILNTHKKMNTAVVKRTLKENMNVSLNDELENRKEELKKMLEFRIFKDMDYEKLEEYINKIPTLSRKEIFVVWTLYNIQTWYRLNKFNETIKI